MLGLRSLNLHERYRSDREDVVASFYVPTFQVASTYDRAVGYFTSTSLALYARGLEAFLSQGGSMRLIASPYLNDDDIADIERGYDLREVIQRTTIRELDPELVQIETVLDGLSLLGKLIAQGRLDIQLAFVEQDGRVGIYHEKIGVFRDHFGDVVAFTGSSNETHGGLMANFESIEVYRGWVTGDGSRALRLEADFHALWSNQTPNLSVEPFPEVARDRLIDLGKDRPYRSLAGRDDALVPRDQKVSEPRSLTYPRGLTVRDYQREAVESWLKNQGRGILKMATGTGKTKTAMIAATILSDVLRKREQPLVVLVIAPLQHLVDQWILEINDFGVHPVAVYESSQRWLPLVEEQLAEARMGQRPLVTIVATNVSFAGARFQSVLERTLVPILIIADEVHNLGSARYRAALPANATYRLALSATPERWFDDEGTDALSDYFGPVVFELGLAKAIAMGALTRYRYMPRLVELNEDETNLYVSLSAQIAARLASGEDLKNAESDSPLGFLLRQRANVLGHAEGKLPALRSDLEACKDEWFQLIYCGEGRRPTEPGEPPGPRQIEQVMDLVGNQLHLAGHPYTSETRRQVRQVLLHRFGAGDDLRVLVAMRCLDEGVDIPDARIGYLLASSSNPRQFIQRRGRLLRRAENKERADIYDYLAVPPSSVSINFSIERSLLIRELERANEFGKISENYETTLEVLRPLKERYQLMDM